MRCAVLALSVTLIACGDDDDDDTVSADAAVGEDAGVRDGGDGDAGDAGDDGDAGDPLEHLAATEPGRLSPGNEDGQDEDPALLVRSDGSLLCAWYSNRNGTQPDGSEDKEIFVMASRDGVAWTDPPAQATRADGWAFAPTLAEDGDGVVHLAWFQLTPLPEGCTPNVDCTGAANRLFAARSADGVTWELDAAEQVTSGPGDWLPALLWDGERGQIALYFSAVVRDEDGAVDFGEGRARIYRVLREDDGWSAPERLVDVDTETTHEQYPQASLAADGTVRLTWTRYPSTTASDPVGVIEAKTSDTMVAVSGDGLTFQDVRTLSDGGEDGALDVFPSFYADRVVWLTTALGDPVTVDLPFDGAFPADAIERPEIAGYTARVAVTHTPGIVWVAWVSGAAPTQKIEHAFLPW